MTALFLLTLAVVSAVEVQHVILEVTEHDTIVHHSESLGERQVDFEVLHSRQEGSRVPGSHNIYYHAAGTTKLARAVRNPRVTIEETFHENGTMSGRPLLADVGYIAVTLPSHASHVTVVREGERRVKHTLQVPRYHQSQSAKFTAQQHGPAEPISDPALTQVIGAPETQKNLIFVSGGYQSKVAFTDNMKLCFDFLRRSVSGNEPSIAGLQPSPWDRYMGLINVFGVYQRSAGVGASFPRVDGIGGHPSRGVVTVNDNLGCNYGTKVLRLLNCKIPLAQNLAFKNTVAFPETSTVIALVNENFYGGSGGRNILNSSTTAKSGVASVYNGEKMVKVLIHEMGHADAELSDEYNYEFSEASELVLENCWYASTGTPWQRWITKGVLPSPVQVCGYTNYYKPTPGRCLMNTELSNEYCAACAESVIGAVVRDVKNFITPRCPREFETLVVTNNPADEHWLQFSNTYMQGPPAVGSLTRKSLHHTDAAKTPLRFDDGAITVTWTQPDGTTVSGVSSLKFKGSDLGIGRHTFWVNITDHSQFVEDPAIRAKLTYKTAFRVEVVASTNTTWGNCTTASFSSVTDVAAALAGSSNLNECTGIKNLQGLPLYCGICDPGRICNDSYTSAFIEATADVGTVLAGIEKIIFGVGGAIVAAGLISFVFLWFFFAYKLRNDVDDVIPLPKPIKIMRWMMLLTAIFVMLASVVVGFYGAYVYNELGAYGRAFILAGMVFAGILFMVSFIGFTAAYFRSRILLIINGILLLLVVVALVIISAIILYVGMNVNTETFQTPLEDQWLKQVTKDPAATCSFQRTFKCSGFTNSCHNKFNSQCPANCDFTNRDNPNPCFDVFKARVERNFKPAGAVALALTFSMLMGFIFNWLLFAFIRKRKLKLRARLENRPVGWANEKEAEWSNMRAANIMKNLTEAERNALMKEFEKTDKDKSGKIGEKELKRLYRRAFDQDLSDHEVKEVMRRLDADGNERVNFKEFVALYGNEDAEQEKRDELFSDERIAHLDRTEVEALWHEFRRIDKDGSHLMSLKELKLFYRRLYKQEPDEANLQAALNAVDNDKSGNINFFEFCQMFAGKYRPKTVATTTTS